MICFYYCFCYKTTLSLFLFTSVIILLAGPGNGIFSSIARMGQNYMKEPARPLSAWSDSRLRSHVLCLWWSLTADVGLIMGHTGKWPWQQHTESSRPTTYCCTTPVRERPGGERGLSQLPAATHSASPGCQNSIKIGRKGVIPTHIRSLIKAGQLISWLLQCQEKDGGWPFSWIGQVGHCSWWGPHGVLNQMFILF